MTTLQRVTRSSVIDAPIEQVWQVLRDFNSHTAWHPVVAESIIEGNEPSDRVGCVRRFTLRDGARIREQLLALSDHEHRLTYCILEADVPLGRYVASVRLKPVTDGRRTFWHWQSTFATPLGRERELTEMVGREVYEGGFAGLSQYLRDAGPMLAARGLPALGNTATGIVFERTGEADVLAPRDHMLARPGPGEARVRHTAIGVNYLDIYIRRGWVALGEPGAVLGVEAAGVVTEVGADVTQVVPGDRVAYVLLPIGSYSTQRNVPASQLVHVPDTVDDETAAAVLLKGLTAEYLLHRLHVLKPGENVLVHAAAGGLGSILCQWAHALGAQVIGTVSNEDKAREARRHGCQHVIVTSDYRFADAVHAVTGGQGADLIVDGLGGRASEQNFAALAQFGHWVSVGQASGPLAPIDPHLLLGKSATFSAPAIFHYTSDPRRLVQMADRLWDAIASGAIRPLIGGRYPLSAVAEAHRAMESRSSKGCLILLP